MSLTRYDFPISTLLHKLKYGADTSVLPALRTVTEEAAKTTSLKELPVPDLVVPVPLHSTRLRTRGLNQSTYLAQTLFPEHLVNNFLLLRNKETIPQTGLTGAERRRNLRGAFAVSDEGVLAGQSICVVDDVFTTGTTAWECCRALRIGGATEVYVVTLARVVVER